MDLSPTEGINQELSFYSRLSDGTDTLCFSEESLSNKFGSLVLSAKLNFESTYRLVVVASNKLGSAFSQPLKFMLIDIGKWLAYLLSVSTGYLEKVQAEHSIFVVYTCQRRYPSISITHSIYLTLLYLL